MRKSVGYADIVIRSMIGEIRLVIIVVLQEGRISNEEIRLRR